MTRLVTDQEITAWLHDDSNHFFDTRFNIIAIHYLVQVALDYLAALLIIRQLRVFTGNFYYKQLVHDTIEKADGNKVHVTKCPDGHGKVKSPMCCGQDMSCSL